MYHKNHIFNDYQAIISFFIPSMYIPAEEEAEFIKKSLGPAFSKAGLATKIIIYDHNPNRVDYPIKVLNDPEARSLRSVTGIKVLKPA